MNTDSMTGDVLEAVTELKSGVRWEEPTNKRGGGRDPKYDYPAIKEKLIANPGHWLLVDDAATMTGSYLRYKLGEGGFTVTAQQYLLDGKKRWKLYAKKNF